MHGRRLENAVRQRENDGRDGRSDSVRVCVHWGAVYCVDDSVESCRDIHAAAAAALTVAAPVLWCRRSLGSRSWVDVHVRCGFLARERERRLHDVPATTLLCSSAGCATERVSQRHGVAARN